MYYLDLCSGIGSYGYALEKRGVKGLAYSEISKHALDIYNLNFKDMKNLDSASEIDETTLDDFDILTGSTPVQIFDRKMTRTNTILSKFIDILNHKLPRYFIFDNVRGFLNINNGEQWNYTKELFEKHYNIKYKVLNVYEYGLPQYKSRLFVIGQKKDFGDFNFEFPKQEILRKSVSDFLQEKVDDEYYLTKEAVDKIINSNSNIDFNHTNSSYKLVNFDSSVASLSRMCSIKTCCDFYTTEYKPTNKSNVRMLTPRECARLNGFGEEFRLTNDKSDYRALANCTPVNLINVILDQLKIS